MEYEDIISIITNLPVGLQYTIAILVVLATIGFPITAIVGWVMRWPMFKLWPHREGWSGDCPKNSNYDAHSNAWQGGLGQRWSQNREMRVGDFFLLNIAKPRVIGRIKLFTEGDRHPKKYMLAMRENKDAEWEDIGEYETLDVTLPHPRKMIAVRWTVTEPSNKIWPDVKLPVAWSIYEIELTEIRLFGKYWRKVITEK